MHGAKVKKNFI